MSFQIDAVFLHVTSYGDSVFQHVRRDLQGVRGPTEQMPRCSPSLMTPRSVQLGETVVCRFQLEVSKIPECF